MRLLEAKAAEMAQKSQPVAPASGAGSNIMFVRGETTGTGTQKNKVVNPDEIDIGDSDEEEEEDEAEEVEIPVQKQAVPAKVFGGLKKADDEDEEDE